MAKNSTAGSGKDKPSSSDPSHAEHRTNDAVGTHPNAGHEMDRSRHDMAGYGAGRHSGDGYDASREDGDRHAPKGKPSRKDPPAQDGDPGMDSGHKRNEPDTSDQEHSAFDDGDGSAAQEPGIGFRPQDP